MLKNTLTLSLILLFLWPAVAQENTKGPGDLILEVKQSFILLRLQTSQKKIDLLKANGEEEKAEKLTNAQFMENREIMLSFENTFDFCPVYFFYAENSEAIREGQLEGNVFSSRRELVDGSKLNQRPFFTAEFSQTEKLGISGLILMDQFMVPLESPFPYYERMYIFFSLVKQSKARIAERYNAKLHAFYDRYH